MKVVLLLLVVLLTHLKVSSQDLAVVAASRLNILYRGVDNPVSIAVPKWPCAALYVSITDGTIKGDGCAYTVRAGGQPQTWIVVKGIEGQDTTDIGEYAFRVFNPPLPVAHFAGFSGSNNLIDKSVLLAGRGIVSRLDNFDFDIHLKITSFDLELTTTTGIHTRLHASNAHVSEEMRNAMLQLGKGDSVLLTNIKSTAADGSLTILEPIALEVK